MQNLMQIRCSTCSVILNVTTTQYTCSLNSIYRPHWQVQWNCHCSCTHIPVLSPWLPDYVNIAQTILFILTMARLFPERPCVSFQISGFFPFNKYPEVELLDHIIVLFLIFWGTLIIVILMCVRWYLIVDLHFFND